MRIESKQQENFSWDEMKVRQKQYSPKQFCLQIFGLHLLKFLLVEWNQTQSSHGWYCVVDYIL